MKYEIVNDNWEVSATRFKTRGSATRAGNKFIDEHGGYFHIIPDKNEFLVAVCDAGWLKKID